MSGPADAVRGVHGWASEIDAPRYEAPAVIVNADASTAALVAWALGQTEQVNAVLAALTTVSTDSGSPASALAGAIQHFTEQVWAVLVAVQERLNDEPPGTST